MQETMTLDLVVQQTFLGLNGRYATRFNESTLGKHQLPISDTPSSQNHDKDY